MSVGKNVEYSVIREMQINQNEMSLCTSWSVYNWKQFLNRIACEETGFGFSLIVGKNEGGTVTLEDGFSLS